MDSSGDTTPDYCPVEAAIAVIGGKWKLLILRRLLIDGPHRFNQLLDTLGVSSKVLSENLRALEDDGLLRHADTGAPYEVSAHAARLTPIFKALGDWAEDLDGD